MILTSSQKNCLKLLLLLIPSILISGCVNNKLQKYDPNNPLEISNNKAIIVLDVQDDQVRINKFDENYNNPRVKPFSYTLSPNGLIFRDNSFKDAFFTIEPGIYYISHAKSTTGYDPQITHYTILPGLTQEGRVVYGAFKVNPGEVAFLGKIDSILSIASSKTSANLFFVKSNLDEAKQKILESGSKYKPLVSKLQKITFYPSGSRIYLDKNGEYNLSLD